MGFLPYIGNILHRNGRIWPPERGAYIGPFSHQSHKSVTSMIREMHLHNKWIHAKGCTDEEKVRFARIAGIIVGGLFAMGIFTRRIGTRSALAGFAGSLVIVLLCHAHTHISPVLYGFIGLVSCFVIGYLASFIFGYRK